MNTLRKWGILESGTGTIPKKGATEMAEQVDVRGKRLTCPVCRDSGFYPLAQIAASNGRIRCTNHLAPVDMVDLVTLLEILVPTGEVHPDDFDNWEEEDALEHDTEAV